MGIDFSQSIIRNWLVRLGSAAWMSKATSEGLWLTRYCSRVSLRSPGLQNCLSLHFYWPLTAPASTSRP
jgi:hypothetical protein